MEDSTTACSASRLFSLLLLGKSCRAARVVVIVRHLGRAIGNCCFIGPIILSLLRWIHLGIDWHRLIDYMGL